MTSAWRFVVYAQAERVFLHHEQPDGVRSWHEMTRDGTDRWMTEQQLDPRGCRFSYCIFDHGTIMNCGAAGLRIESLLEDHATPFAVHAPLDATGV